MRRSRAAPAAVLIGALLGACSSPAPLAPTAPVSTGAAPTTTAAPTTVSTIPPTPPVTEARADGTGFGLLRAVRVASQDGADRIVFEFAAAVPGYRISYVDLPVTSDPAGLPVALAGTAALQVSLVGSSAYAEVGDTEPAYRGPSRVPGAGTVTELVSLGDFERVLVWAAGVGSRNGFRVSTLDGPPRLVIDVVR